MKIERENRKGYRRSKGEYLNDQYDISNGLLDSEILELEELLQEEMYEFSEQRLYQFYKNFWNCHDPAQLHTSWVQECVAEHIQAALNRDIRRLTISIPPRCLPEDTSILMSDGGYKALKDIKVGEYVKSSNSHVIRDNRVLRVIDSGEKECIRLTFDDGTELVTSKEHKIYTSRGYIKCEDLEEGQHVYSHMGEEYSSREEISLDDAFLLGCWIGDGTKGARGDFRITNQTESIVNKLKEVCARKGWQYRPSTNNVELDHRWINPVSYVKGYGNKGDIRLWFDRYIGENSCTICYDTVVPSIIFRSSREIKIEFLNAFMACDGYIDSTTGRFGTEVSSKQLAIDIHRLLKQLGVDSRLSTRAARGEFINPQGLTCNSREHYSCRVSRSFDIERSIGLFHFYGKSESWSEYKIRDKIVRSDIPLEEIEEYIDIPTWIEDSKTISVSINSFKKLFNKRDLGILHEVEEKYRNGTRWRRIVKKEDVGIVKCMDITVERDHNFYANDILVSNSGKSTISISSICWHWLQNPWEKFWLVSHSAKLFIQNIVLTRRIMEHPLYAERWMNPENEEHYKFMLAKDVNTKTRVENNQGGYILGGSPTSGALGMGYSVAFLDDVLDSEQANSPEAVEKVNNWYTQTFLNRSNDVENDVQVIVMQRLAENDIIHYVNDTYGDQGWFNLVLPAKYDPQRIFFSPIGWNDPRKHKNELLDPVRLPDSFLEAQKKNAIIYNTRYQQDPGAGGEGNLIQSEWLQETHIIPKSFDQMITVWDLSFGDSPTASYSVGIVFGSREGKFYVIDMIRKRMAVPEQVDSIREFKKKYPKSHIGVEKRANGNAAISLLEREIHNIYAFQPRLFGGSKEQRISTTFPYLRDKRLFIYSPFQEDTTRHKTYDADVIIKELKSFPLGATDDIVDCFGYGIQWLAEYGKEATAIITGGKELEIPELRDQSSVYLRNGTVEEEQQNYEYDMFGDITSRTDIMYDLNF